MQQKEQEELRRMSIASSVVLAFDLFDLTGIFFMNGSTTFLKMLFEQITRYFMLPIAAASAIIISILTWRQAHLNHYQGHTVAKAVFETICAAALTTAVIGTFAVTALFAMAGPVMIAAAFGAKALFNLGSALYFGIQAARTSDPVKKYEFRKQAAESAIGAIVGIGTTAAVIAVMLLAKPVLAIIGIMAGAFGCAAAIIKCVDLTNPKPGQKVEAEKKDDSSLTNNAGMAKTLNVTRTEKNSADVNTVSPERDSINNTEYTLSTSLNAAQTPHTPRMN